MRTFLACLAVLVPAAAFPCGGFFCSGGNGNPPPVIQTGEKILFGFENGEVTAHVQILYAGEPRAFAWVVPTPSLPTLAVGSDQLFTLLDQGTSPTFSPPSPTHAPRPPAACSARPAPSRVEPAAAAAAGSPSSPRRRWAPPTPPS